MGYSRCPLDKVDKNQINQVDIWNQNYETETAIYFGFDYSEQSIILDKEGKNNVQLYYDLVPPESKKNDILSNTDYHLEAEGYLCYYILDFMILDNRSKTKEVMDFSRSEDYTISITKQKKLLKGR
jgi:hypothetical protein